LFGCSQAAGHWTGKFVVRLRSKRQGEVKPVEGRQPSENTLAFNQPAPPVKPIRVTVEDGALAKFGFWVALVSGIVSVAQAFVPLVH
jgi:hypothetical protein